METIDRKINITVPNLEEQCNVLNKLRTRNQWQEICKQKLLAGKDGFQTWQHDLLKQSLSKNSAFFTWNISYGNNAKLSNPLILEDQIVIDLSNVVFEDELNLDGFDFMHTVWFGGVTFNKSVTFKNTIFRRQVFFVGAKFNDNVSFAKTCFTNENNSYINPNFNDSVFKGKADFMKSYFRAEIANFKRVEFLSDANFELAEFDNFACFDGALFSKEANFSGEVYGKNKQNEKQDDKLQTFNSISFSGTHFKNRAIFNNRDFRGTTSFGKYKGQMTKFDLAPLFHNCKLFQGTTFVDAEFDISESDELAAQAFNTLKLAMSQQQSTRDEHNFIKKELDVELIKAKKRSEKRLLYILYILYKKIADYGFSAMSPFIKLLCIPAFAFCLCYGFFTSWYHCNSISLLFSDSCSLDISLVIQTIEFTVLQFLPPLGLDKHSYAISEALFGAETAEQRVLVTFFIIIQKIMAIAGWFFVALALRNLFKMK